MSPQDTKLDGQSNHSGLFKSNSKVPLSLEEIHRKHQERIEQQNKPKFLTKSERERLAKEEQQRELAEKKKKIAQVKKSYQTYLTSHLREDHLKSKKSSRQDNDEGNSAEVIQKQVMIEKAIKDRYLGSSEPRKKRKLRDRKFEFDWNEADDTSTDYNDLYTNRHTIQFFGRGNIAGIDTDVQKKNLDQVYKNLKHGANSNNLSSKTTSKNIVAEQWTELHWSEKPSDKMTARDWRIFKEDFDISSKGGNVPNPIRNWSECEYFSSDLLKILKENNFAVPTPIQRQAIPAAVQNRDVIGLAETGSGKTLAFLLPLISWLLKLSPTERAECSEHGPFAVVLAPTRELVMQIYEVLSNIGAPLKLKSTAITGGTFKELQSLQLKIGVEAIVATPGRLVDLLNRQLIVLSQCVFVVMDEADKMIDMGFEIDVQTILESLPVSNLKPDSESAEDTAFLTDSNNFLTKHRYRQTLMFSATMSQAIERLAKKYLRRPVVVYVGIAGKPTKNVEQVVIMLSESAKKERLVKVIESHYKPPIIIFVNHKRQVDQLKGYLEQFNFRTAALHGGKSQDARQASILDLKEGFKDILVATDVAGRGLDIQNVSLVLNYDMPKSIDTYVHRIGRTGRAGQKGLAISFVTQEDSDIFYDLKKTVEESVVSSVPRELASHPSAQTRPGSFANLHTASKGAD